MQPANPQAKVHTIRLAGPWTFVPISRGPQAGEPSPDCEPALPAAGRLKLPGDWSCVLGDGFRGTARLERNFNWPAQLASGERVLLVITAVTGSGEVSLNGQALGQCSQLVLPWQQDVTSLLERRNRLEIVLESHSAAGGLPGEIRLDIHQHR